MNIPFLQKWPIDVDIYRLYGENTFVPTPDKARVIDIKGADYFELKSAKAAQNKNARLKASEFKNINVKNKLTIFELNRGYFTASRVELRTQYDNTGKIVMKEIEVGKADKDGRVKKVNVPDTIPVLVPVIDANADITHVEDITKIAEMSNTQGWLEKHAGLIALIVVAVISFAGMWFGSNAQIISANANVETAKSWALVANATEGMAVCRALLERVAATVPAFAP
jgi:hypothetical protein